MRTYTPTLTLRLLVGIFLLAPALVLLGFAIAGTNPAVTGGIGAPLLVIGAVLWWLGGRARLTIDENGLKRLGYLGGVTEIAFADVSEYRYSSTTVNGVDTVRLSVSAADGRKVMLTSNWREPFDAAKQLIDGAETHGLQDQKARPGEFGPIRIEGDAIVQGNKRVPFNQIKAVAIPGARLRVTQEGKLLAAIAVDSFKVPNVFLLLDELRAHGVSAPDARPWRAVVSLAGYQLPKK